MVSTIAGLWDTFRVYWYSILVIPTAVVYLRAMRRKDRAVFEEWARSNAYTVVRFDPVMFGVPLTWSINRNGGRIYRIEVSDRPDRSKKGWVKMPFLYAAGTGMDLAQFKWDD